MVGRMTDTIAAEMLARLAQGKTFHDLAGKVVFITGAGKGIGLAMARAFAACDARLALLDIDAAVLQAACASLQAEFPGVQVQTWAAAVNDEAAVNDAVHAAHAAFGHIDILLNNAGISMNQPKIGRPSCRERACQYV